MTHPKRSVYLAGPISGLTHDGARHGWREDFQEKLDLLGADHISCFSPMRGKEFLKDFGVLTSGVNYPDHPMASPSGITIRDYNDLSFSDVLVGCFLETPKVQLFDGTWIDIASQGTCWEFGAGYALHKPIVMIADPDNIHVQHIMMSHSAGYIVPTLEQGVELVYFLLTPGI